MKGKLFFSLLAIAGLIGVSFAQDSGAKVGLSMTNLPASFSGEFTLELTTTAGALSGAESFSLSFSECGSGQTELWYGNQKKSDQISSFSLASWEKKSFPLKIKARNIHGCQLNFKLTDTAGVKVAETSMVLNSNCDLPIDFDQEYVLSQQASNSQRGKAWVNKTTSVNNTTRGSLDKELENALDWAVRQGIISQADKARFNNPMTRMELAQMILPVGDKLGRAANEGKACSFKDLVGTPEASIATAKRVCQLNVMGIYPNEEALENFMPDQIVDRAQMLTTISRMLWGNSYNQGGKTFYEKHFDKVKEENVVRKPFANLVELRSYFYLVLQRAAEKGLLKWQK